MAVAISRAPLAVLLLLVQTQAPPKQIVHTYLSAIAHSTPLPRCGTPVLVRVPLFVRARIFLDLPAHRL